MSNEILDVVLSLRGNPGRTQQYILNLMERLSGGDAIAIDATNPVVFCLESGVVMGTATMMDNENKLRRQYPEMALTMEELYLHMADADYYGVFSTPATGKITFMFDNEEIKQKAVKEPGTGGTRRLTIPAFTKVTVSDTQLTLLYPIDIRIMPHGGYNITFNTSAISPLARVENNMLEWFIDTIDNVDYLNIVAPVYQLNVVREVVSTNAVSGFKREYAFTDNYCYARAYIQNQNGSWQEIRTTYTDMVYNKDTPTVILKVLNQTLSVTIPQIYFNNRLINDSVLIDIYTTKGPMDISLTNFAPKSYNIDWSPLNSTGVSEYSAPLNTLSISGVYSNAAISGGTMSMSFSELKQNITNRSAIYEGLPISEKQLVRNVKNLGYTVVKNIDNITDRQYLATKALPTPDDKFIATSMPMTVKTLETPLIALKELASVTSSTYRSTVKPDTLYQLTDGILTLVPSAKVADLKTKAINDPTTLVATLNQGNYLYSPFYYVLDIKNGEIASRIYDMDNPRIHSRFFFQENDSVGMLMGINNYAIAKSPDGQGYILEIQLSIGQGVDLLGPDYINVQLSYVGKDEPNRYFIEGTLVSPIDPSTGKPYEGQYIYQFKIETQYDIDSSDGLIPTPYISPINLMHEFDIVTILKNYNPNIGITVSDIDSIINTKSLPGYSATDRYIGVSQHKVTIEFGKRLDKLWNKTRTVVDVSQRDVYTADVPKRYSQDVYELDSTGNMKISYDAANNNITFNKLHSAGDVMLAPNGEMIYQHLKGDPKFDVNGEPIYLNGGNGLLRQIDLFLVDASYYFANTPNVIDYKQRCMSLLTNWITSDMQLLTNQLLDRSEMFFHPPVSIGNIKVTADNNQDIMVKSKQHLTVRCFITEIDMKNASLREALGKNITQIVQAALSKRVVSRDSLFQALRTNVGDTVISFEILGFLNDRYRAVTITDETANLSLGTKMVALTNGLIDIRDDIVVEFVTHIES